METPLISIIIPVYNVYPYLSDCFNALIRQNYPKLEFIIVDDGSNDGSGVLCDNFAKSEPRAKVYHQDNLGLSAARNRGLKESKGEYVTFLDSDDTIAPDYIAYLFSMIRKHHVKLSICAIKETTTKGRIKDYGAGYSPEILGTVEALGRMLREEGYNVSAYAKLYHKDLWQGITFPEGVVHEDLGTTYKLIEQCPQVAYGPAAKYFYQKREQSLSSAPFSDAKLAIVQLTDQMCDDLEPKYPYLLHTLNLRRMHARFSVLRQTLQVKNPSKSLKKAQQEIIKYLRLHKKFITKNPAATLRDKMAIRALLLGKNVFKISWNLYDSFRN